MQLDKLASFNSFIQTRNSSRLYGVIRSVAMTWSKRKTVILIAVALFVLLWPWVYMISCVGYTYGYWLFPNLTWANPGEVPSEESLPVPALIHQTWKTQQVPEKWAKAQQSCIDLHPDYEYKLWTDDDGLELIKVRKRKKSATATDKRCCFSFVLDHH